MKKIIALALVLVMVLGMVACTAPKTDKKTIAVIAKGESHAFWQAVKAGAERAAKEKGYELTFQGPSNEDPSNAPEQVKMVQSGYQWTMQVMAITQLMYQQMDIQQ